MISKSESWSSNQPSNSERINNLDRVIAEGLIVRNTLFLNFGNATDLSEGQACILTALSPEVALADNPEACPPTVLPLWMAFLVHRLSEGVSAAGWPAFSVGFAKTLRRIYTLTDDKHLWTDADWDHQSFLACSIFLRLVAPRAGHSLTIVNDALWLCGRAANGHKNGSMPLDAEWEATRRLAQFAKETAQKEALAADPQLFLSLESFSKARAANGPWAAASTAEAATSRMGSFGIALGVADAASDAASGSGFNWHLIANDLLASFDARCAELER